MTPKANWLASILAVAAMGCSKGSTPSPAQPETIGMLTVRPGDNSTGVGLRPSLDVVIHNYGRPIDKSLLDTIAAGTFLVSWPEGDKIAVDRAVNATPEADAGSEHITLLPREQLMERWYALAVTTVPEGFLWSADPVALAADGKARGVRFFPSSRPMIASVSRYKNKDETRRYILKASEVIASGGDALSSLVDLRETGAAKACTPAGIVGESIYIDCTETLSGDAEVSISVGAGLKSTSGVSLTEGASRLDIQLKSDEWEKGSDGVDVVRRGLPGQVEGTLSL